MTRKTPLRLAATLVLAALSLPGCTAMLAPDPLNKTTSIVNGTQVTRGPMRGTVPSGFAAISTAPAGGATFEPAVGEAFGLGELDQFASADLGLPELQGIDFDAEQAGVAGIVSSGGAESAPLAAADRTVYFATDSADLDERARETLRRQAAWLNVNPSARATVEGHADERGTREYNLALGDRRASATRGYLVAVGVDESRLDKISYGKERPVALGSDPQAWSRNRRTETAIEDGGGFAGAAFDGTAAFDPPVAGSVGALDTATLPAFPMQEPISGTSDSLALDPLFPQDGTTALIAPPGSITYETTSGLFPPAPSAGAFEGGTIAPTVFDTASPARTATPATRIEDVSVDDLLRDPSLIDRIGSPATSVPGS